MTPPSTQQLKIGPEVCSCAATVAGTRKMPLPMAMPTDTATVCSRLTERGMRSPHWSAIRHRESFCEQLRRAALEGGDLGTQQPLRQLRLQDGIGARRAAAFLAVADRSELESRGGKERFDGAAHSERVLQRARGMKGDPRRSAPRTPRPHGRCAAERSAQRFALLAEDLGDVPG